jgi:flagellar biogenesis protein FliO
MGFINELLGTVDNNIWVLLGGLAITIVAIIAVVWLLKFAFNASRNGFNNRVKRLGVVNTMAVDNKRQLVIVRRDNKEHLIMIGGPNDVVIETGIDPEDAVTLAQTTAPRGKAVAETNIAKPEPKVETKTTPVAATTATPIRQPVPNRPMGDGQAPRIVPQPAANQETTDIPKVETSTAAISKLRELGQSKPDSTVSTLKYPGILRPVTRHKGVDSDENTENLDDQDNDSDKFDNQEAPEVELANGADDDEKSKSSKSEKQK